MDFPVLPSGEAMYTLWDTLPTIGGPLSPRYQKVPIPNRAGVVARAGA